MVPLPLEAALADNDNETATPISLVEVPVGVIFALNADLLGVRTKIVSAKRQGAPAEFVAGLRRLEQRLLKMLLKVRQTDASRLI
jgi:hypothetical protein